MTTTYPAFLRDGRVEWTDEVPSLPADGQPLRVNITVLDPIAKPASDQGQRMAAALLSISASSTSNMSQIQDPLAWEREQREDRVLPGREA